MSINISNTDLDTIRVVIQRYYKPQRLPHALSVEKECISLAEIYDLSEIDTMRLRAAALLHDITKRLSHGEQLAYCKKNNIFFTEEEKHMPKVFHARTGAHFARVLYPELVDDEIYEAIFYHTTAKPEMTLMTKLLYLADYIEPSRSFPECLELRRSFYAMLDKSDNTDKYCVLKETIIRSFGLTLYGLIDERAPIHCDIITALNYYLLQNNEDIT